jgi:hypothetical protein
MSIAGMKSIWIVNYDGSSWDTQVQAEKHAKKSGGGLVMHAVILTKYAVDQQETTP